MTQTKEAPTVFNQNKVWRLAKTYVLLLCFLPLCLTITVIYYLSAKVKNAINIMTCRSKKVAVGSKNQTIVINGGKMQKSLAVCKWFGQAGYNVVVIESPRYFLCNTRFSKYCSKFYTVTDCRQNPEQYKKDIIKICKDVKASYWLPVCAPSSEKLDSEIAKILNAEGIKSICCSIDIMDTMQDKHLFGEYTKKLGLPSIDTYRVSSDEDVLEVNKKLNDQEYVFVLKNIQFDPAHRLDLFKLPCNESSLLKYLKKIRDDGNPITNEEPWQVQRFIKGEEYSCAVIVQEGNVQVYADSISTPSQFDWLSVHHPKIKKWMQDFARLSMISGVYAVDFMVDEKTNEAFPIECNPRFNSQLMMCLANDNMADNVLKKSTETVYPVLEVGIYNIYNDWFRLVWPEYYGYDEDLALWFPQRLINFINSLLFKYDLVLDGDDIMPFFALGFLQTFSLLFSNFQRGYDWKKVDFQIGKIVEVGGD